MYKLFGREPALWLALIASGVILVSTFFFPLSIEQQGGINAASSALFGLLTAWAVARNGLQAAILGFLKALIALAISFGLQWTPEQQLIVMGFLEPLTAMFVRQNAVAPVNEAGKEVQSTNILTD